jgi:hypothetical protein
MLSAGQRFARSYVPVPESGCWLWLGHIMCNGYGQLRMDSKSYRETAHRAAYLLHKGDIADGMQVLHMCDVKSCVNPAHLYLGDHAQNMRDAVSRGRHQRGDAWKKSQRQLPRGEKHPGAKLSSEDVAQIRASTDSGVVLASRFAVSTVTISRIRRRIVWRDCA